MLKAQAETRTMEKRAEARTQKNTKQQGAFREKRSAQPGHKGAGRKDYDADEKVMLDPRISAGIIRSIIKQNPSCQESW